MTVAGNIYGVVLNDAEELARLAPELDQKPYAAPPVWPVVYMKPLASLASGPIPVPATGLVAAATLAVLFARDTGGVAVADIPACIGATALALDLALPTDSYYRPAVAQKNAPGRLALGNWAGPKVPPSIRLWVDGSTIHEWPLDRLSRAPLALIAELGSYLTLKAGDVLLVGLPGDAPLVAAGQELRIEADGMPTLEVVARKDAA
jgi:5-oxopent-3-ene-1,2,5-tricarboxylate decarboxylase/2-hydroxyhepta-2,4-diene-1,7-dioate isomerase